MESNKIIEYLLGTSQTPGIGNTFFEIVRSPTTKTSYTVMQIYVNEENEVVKAKESEIKYWYQPPATMTMMVSPSVKMTLRVVGSNIILKELAKVYQQRIDQKEKEIAEIKKKIPTSLDNL